MRKMVYFCDKCGCPIPASENLFVVKVHESKRCTNGLETEGDPHPDYGDDGKELCEQCANNLLKVDEPKGSKEETDSAKEPDPVHITDKGDRRCRCGGKEVDLGKMFALKRNGWSNQMIADEFGLKRLDVSNSMSRHSAKYKAFLAGKWEVKEKDEFSD